MKKSANAQETNSPPTNFNVRLSDLLLADNKTPVDPPRRHQTEKGSDLSIILNQINGSSKIFQAAIDRENLKSSFARNAISQIPESNESSSKVLPSPRRQPPPPPRSISLPVHTGHIKRVLEAVDYTPLSSPEHKEVARHNIARLISRENVIRVQKSHSLNQETISSYKPNHRFIQEEKMKNQQFLSRIQQLEERISEPINLDKEVPIKIDAFSQTFDPNNYQRLADVISTIDSLYSNILLTRNVFELFQLLNEVTLSNRQILGLLGINDIQLWLKYDKNNIPGKNEDESDDSGDASPNSPPIPVPVPVLVTLGPHDTNIAGDDNASHRLVSVKCGLWDKKVINQMFDASHNSIKLESLTTICPSDDILFTSASSLLLMNRCDHTFFWKSITIGDVKSPNGSLRGLLAVGHIDGQTSEDSLLTSDSTQNKIVMCIRDELVKKLTFAIQSQLHVFDLTEYNNEITLLKEEVSGDLGIESALADILFNVSSSLLSSGKEISGTTSKSILSNLDGVLHDAAKIGCTNFLCPVSFIVTQDPECSVYDSDKQYTVYCGHRHTKSPKIYTESPINRQSAFGDLLRTCQSSMKPSVLRITGTKLHNMGLLSPSDPCEASCLSNSESEDMLITLLIVPFHISTHISYKQYNYEDDVVFDTSNCISAFIIILNSEQQHHAALRYTPKIISHVSKCIKMIKDNYSISCRHSMIKACNILNEHRIDQRLKDFSLSEHLHYDYVQNKIIKSLNPDICAGMATLLNYSTVNIMVSDSYCSLFHDGIVSGQRHFVTSSSFKNNGSTEKVFYDEYDLAGNQNKWLTQLYANKVVTLSDIPSIMTNNKRIANSSEKGIISLKDLILEVAPHACHATLIPVLLATATGVDSSLDLVAVIMLTEEKQNFDNYTNSSNDEHLSNRSQLSRRVIAPISGEGIQSSALVKFICSIFEDGLQYLSLKSHMLATEKKYADGDVKLDRVCGIMDKIKNRDILRKSFTNWKDVRKSRRRVEGEMQTDRLIDLPDFHNTLVDLLNVLQPLNGQELPHVHKSSSDTLSRYLYQIEACMVSLFPHDIVVVKDYNFYTDRAVQVSASNIEGAVVTKVRNTIFAYIKIFRSMGDFCAVEKDVVSRFCTSAGMFLDGYYQEMLKEDYMNERIDMMEQKQQVEKESNIGMSYMLPFLNNVMPSLLIKLLNDSLNDGTAIRTGGRTGREGGSNDRSGGDDLSFTIKEIVAWMKVCCNADVAIVRLKGNDIYDMKEYVISSDDHSVPFNISQSKLSTADETLSSIVEETSTSEDQISIYLTGEVGGELKFIGSKRRHGGFSDVDKNFAKLISYILLCNVHTEQIISRKKLLIRQRHLVESELGDKILALRDEVGTCAVEKNQIIVQLSFFRQLMSTLNGLHKCVDLGSVARIIYNSLPKLLLVKSCVLLLKLNNNSNDEYQAYDFREDCNPVSALNDDFEDNFSRKFSYRSIGDEDPFATNYSSTSQNALSSDRIYKHSELRRISDFNLINVKKFHHQVGNGSSKILLTHSNAKDHYGAILIDYVTYDATNLSSKDSILQLDDDIIISTQEIFQESILSNISAVVKKIHLDVTMQQNEQSALKIQELQENNLQLKNEMKSSVEEALKLNEYFRAEKMEKESIAADLDNTLAQQEELKNEVDDLQQKYFELEKQHHVELKKLLVEIQDTSEAKEVLDKTLTDVEAIIVGYGIDMRSGNSNALKWLADTAHRYCNSYLYVIHQKENGTLSASLEKSVEGSVSLVSINESVLCEAARDAMRELKSIETVTAIDKTTKAETNRTRGYDTLTTLCIPNRSGVFDNVALIVCYAFVRYGGNSFTENEKLILTCVSTIANKDIAMCLAQQKLIPDDMTQLRTEYDKAKNELAYMKNVVIKCNEINSVSHKTWQDLSSAIERGIVAVMSQKEGSPTFTSKYGSIECAVWQPTSSQVGFGYYSNDIVKHSNKRVKGFNEDAVMRVLSTGKIFRNGNVMFVPLKLHTNETVGIAYIERSIHFKAEFEMDSFGFEGLGEIKSSHDDGSSVNKSNVMSDIVFTASDERIVTMFSNMVITSFDKLKNHKNTIESIQSASLAIQTLQDNQSALEIQISQSIAYRMKYEECLRLNSDILEGTKSARMDMIHILETARRSLLKMTSSVACEFITNFPIEFQPSGDTSFDQKDVHNELLSTLYYSWSTSSLRPCSVSLENSDVESLCFTSGKPIKLLCGGDVRSHTVSKFMSDKWQSTSNSISTEGLNLYMLAIPFSLRDGSSAVVVLLRHEYIYDDADEANAMWTTKNVSICLDMRHDRTVISKNKETILLLSAELESNKLELADINVSADNHFDTLANYQRHVSTLQNGIDMLQDNLISPYDIPPLELKDSLTSSSTNYDDQSEESFSDTDIRLYRRCFTTLFGSANCQVWNAIDGKTLDIEMILGSNAQGQNAEKRVIKKGNLKLTFWEECLPDIDNCTFFYISGVLQKLHSTVSPVMLRLTCSAELHKSIYELKMCITIKLIELCEKLYIRFDQVTSKLKQQSEEMVVSLKSAINVLETKQKESAENFLHQIEMKEDEFKNKDTKIKQLMEQVTDNYKVTFKEKIKESKSNYEFLLRIVNAGKFLCSLNDLLENAYSSDALISNVYISKPKYINLHKIVRKICDILGAPIFMSSQPLSNTCVEAISCSVNYAELDNLAKTSKLHLTWITSTAPWCTTSAISSSSNNALYLACTSRNLVFVTNTEETYLKLISLKNTVKIKAEGNNNRVAATEEWTPVLSNDFPDQTYLIPIPLGVQNQLVVIIVKSNFPADSKCINNNIASLLLITKALLVMIDRHEWHQKYQSTSKANVIFKMLHNLDNKLHNTFQRCSVPKAFARLKHFWIISQKKSFLKEENLLHDSRKQVKILEQSVADWAELVKGVNGSAVGLSLGLTGLWSHACRPLMSMISSHVTLKSCGMLVASDEDRVMDLNVRDLSSFDIFSQVEGRNSNIEVQPASILGNNIENLVISILHGQANQSSLETMQRLWRVSRPPSTNGLAEEMWLVPLRTSQEVLGVLRVTVDVTGDDNAFDANRMYEIGDDRYMEEDSSQFGWDNGGSESAKRNLIHYAEILAPLVTAARNLDIMQSKQNGYEDQLSSIGFKQKIITKELNMLMKRNYLLSASLECISLKNVSLNINDREWSSSGVFVIIKNMIEKEISDIWGCKIFIVSIDEEMEIEAKGKPLADLGSYEVIIKEPLLLTEEVVIPLGSLYAVVTEYPNIDDNDVSALDREAREEHPAYSESNTISAVLKPLANIIVSLFASFTRECEAKKKVTTAVAKLHSMDHRITDLNRKSDEYSYKEIVSKELITYNKLMNDMLISCISHCTDLTYLERINETLGESTAHENIEHMLRKLCNSVPEIVNGKHQKFTLNFGLVNEKLSSSPRSELTLSDMVLVWYHAEEHNSSNIINLPSVVAKSTDTDRISKIALNMAISCIQEGVKSNVDISLNDSDMTGSSSGNNNVNASKSIKMLSFPLSSSGSGNGVVHGVLQIFVTSHESFTLDDDREIDESNRNEIYLLLETISKVVGKIVGSDYGKKKILEKLQVVTRSNISLQNALTASANDLTNVNSKYIVWQSVCRYLYSISKRLDNDENIIDVINSVDKSELTEVSGLTVVVFSNTSTSQLPLLPSRIFYPIYEVTGSLIQLRHEALNQNIVVDSDIIELFSSFLQFMIRSASKRNKLSHDFDDHKNILNQELIECNSKCAMYLEEIHDLRANMALLDSNASDKNMHIATIQNYIPNLMETYFEPIGQDISSLLNDTSYYKDFSPLETSSKLALKSDHSVEITEKLFTAAAKLLQKAFSRVFGTTSCFHASVLIRSKKKRENGSYKLSDSTIMFDGGLGSSGIRLASLRDASIGNLSSSLLERCFTSDTVQELQYESCNERNEAKVNPIDLRGVSDQLCQSILRFQDADFKPANTTSTPDSKSSTILCYPIHTIIPNIAALIRVVYLDVPSSARLTDVTKLKMPNILFIKHMLGFISPLLTPISMDMHAECRAREERSLQNEKISSCVTELSSVRLALDRSRRLYRVVGREVGVMLDPPVGPNRGSSNTQPIHPAALSPLMALQDTCLKLLSVLRTLARSEGQAILLHNDESNPPSFQLIHTGNALSWRGIEQSTFGMVSCQTGASSFVETALKSHKSVITADAARDERYSPIVDGVCDSKTPLMSIPIRGRGTAVIGVVLVARAKDSTEFSREDLSAIEMATTYGSISLYWSKGLNSIHLKVSKSIAKMEQLENAVNVMKVTSSRDNSVYSQNIK